MDSIRTWAEGGCPSGTCGIPRPGGLISNLSYRWGDWEGRQRDWALSLFIWLLLHCSKGKAQPADFPPPELWTWRRLASKKGNAGAPSTCSLDRCHLTSWIREQGAVPISFYGCQGHLCTFLLTYLSSSRPCPPLPQEAWFLYPSQQLPVQSTHTHL